MEYTPALQLKHWQYLSENLLNRLKDDRHTDCVFIIGKNKKKFKLNRFILSLISPVFEVMMYGNMRESENNSTVIIDDVDVEAFKCVVNFAYGSDPEINLSNVTSLLLICDKYQIKELSKIANQFFKTSLNGENFCVLFNEALKPRSNDYCVNACVKFMKEAYLKFDKTTHSEIIKSSFILNVNAMKILLECEYLLLREEIIWEAYIKWRKYQQNNEASETCTQSLDDNDNDNERECKIYESSKKTHIHSGDKYKLYKLIRYGLMDDKYFVKSVLPMKILSDSELVEIMRYSICEDEGCGEFKTNPRAKDCWSKCMGDNLEICDDNCLVHKGPDRSSQSALLTMEFDTGIHKWSFKIKQLKTLSNSSDWTTCFGIYKSYSSKHLPINNHFIWDEKNTGYAFCAHSGQLKVFDETNDYCVSLDYGVECKPDDIIEMIVDMNKLELKYQINGVNYGKAFDIQRTTYRAAVNLDIPGDTIQLL
eukprot:288505_1